MEEIETGVSPWRSQTTLVTFCRFVWIFPIPVIVKYAVSGQTQIGSIIYLRQHRMIHRQKCGLQMANAVSYAVLP